MNYSHTIANRTLKKISKQIFEFVYGDKFMESSINPEEHQKMSLF